MREVFKSSFNGSGSGRLNALVWADRIGFACLLLLPFLVPMRGAPDALEPITDVLGKPWKLTRFLAVVSLVVLVAGSPEVRRRLYHPAFLMLGGLVAVAGLSSLQGVEPMVSFQMLIRELGLYAVVIWLAGATLTTKPRLKWVLGAVTISVGLEAIYAIVIHILHIGSETMSDRLVAAGMIHSHRGFYWAALGTFEYYTTLAKFLVIGLSGALILWKLGQSGWRRTTVLMVAMAVMAWAVVLTTSRSAWMALVAGLISHAVLVQRRAFYVLIALPMLMVILGPDTVQQRMATIVDISQWTDSHRSIQARRFGAEAAFGMLRDHPWLGVGYGRRVYSHLYEEYRSDTHPDLMGDAHSNVFEMAAELGYVGLAAYLGWALTVFFTSFKRWREDAPRVRRHLLGAAITAQVIHHVLGLALFTWKGEVGVLLAIATGVVIVISLPQPFEERAETPHA